MTLPTRNEIGPELLRALLKLGGTAPPRVVIPHVTAAFPQITTDDLALTVKNGSSAWRNRVYWARQDMIETGKMSSPRKGVWALTEQGRAEAIALGDPAASAPPASDEEPRDDAELDAPAPDDEEETGTAAPLEVLPDEADRIARELRDAATASSEPARLETSVANALNFLGFEAKRVSGPGRTDVVAVAQLGVDRYTIVLDAKSSSSGKVSDHQVDWNSISDHREQEHADYSCVVGHAFAAGNLRERAARYNTRLLQSSQLAEIVQMHAASPVSLKALEQLFDASVDLATGMRDLRTASSETGRRRRLPLKLMQIIDTFNKDKPTAILAKPEPLWGVLLHAGDADGKGATLEEVEAALALLVTHGILRRSNGEGYVSQTSLSGAKQMLDAAPADEPPSGDDPAEQRDARAI